MGVYTLALEGAILIFNIDLGYEPTASTCIATIDAQS